VKIPLELAALPTAKEFKDAIASLSPEQQSFARALRLLQLQSTLFGVLVVQVRSSISVAFLYSIFFVYLLFLR